VYSSEDNSQEDLQSLVPGSDGAGKVIPLIKPDQEIISDAVHFGEIAIANLKCIRSDDPKRLEAFQNVENWIAKAKPNKEKVICPKCTHAFLPEEAKRRRE